MRGEPNLFGLSRVVTELDNSQSDFWLHLLHDNGYLNDDQFDSLEKDITRILKILTSIVKTMRTKLGLEKS